MSKTPLRILREARGLTANDVAAAVGMTQGQYSRVENGEGTRAETAEKLADYFGREFLTELHILYPERYVSQPERAT